MLSRRSAAAFVVCISVVSAIFVLQVNLQTVHADNMAADQPCTPIIKQCKCGEKLDPKTKKCVPGSKKDNMYMCDCQDKTSSGKIVSGKCMEENQCKATQVQDENGQDGTPKTCVESGKCSGPNAGAPGAPATEPPSGTIPEQTPKPQSPYEGDPEQMPRPDENPQPDSLLKEPNSPLPDWTKLDTTRPDPMGPDTTGVSPFGSQQSMIPGDPNSGPFGGNEGRSLLEQAMEPVDSSAKGFDSPQTSASDQSGWLKDTLDTYKDLQADFAKGLNAFQESDAWKAVANEYSKFSDSIAKISDDIVDRWADGPDQKDPYSSNDIMDAAQRSMGLESPPTTQPPEEKYDFDDKARLTVYGVCEGMPAGCNSQEGAPTTKETHLDADGKPTNKIYTLNDYADGKVPYVTVASNAERLGETGVLKEITYTDPYTGDTKTLYNVPYEAADLGKMAANQLDVPVTVPPELYGNNAAINSMLNSQPFNQQVTAMVETDGIQPPSSSNIASNNNPNNSFGSQPTEFGSASENTSPFTANNTPIGPWYSPDNLQTSLTGSPNTYGTGFTSDAATAPVNTYEGNPWGGNAAVSPESSFGGPNTLATAQAFTSPGEWNPVSSPYDVGNASGAVSSDGDIAQASAEAVTDTAIDRDLDAQLNQILDQPLAPVEVALNNAQMDAFLDQQLNDILESVPPVEVALNNAALDSFVNQQLASLNDIGNAPGNEMLSGEGGLQSVESKINDMVGQIGDLRTGEEITQDVADAARADSDTNPRGDAAPVEQPTRSLSGSIQPTTPQIKDTGISEGTALDQQNEALSSYLALKNDNSISEGAALDLSNEQFESYLSLKNSDGLSETGALDETSQALESYLALKNDTGISEGAALDKSNAGLSDFIAANDASSRPAITGEGGPYTTDVSDSDAALSQEELNAIQDRKLDSLLDEYKAAQSDPTKVNNDWQFPETLASSEKMAEKLADYLLEAKITEMVGPPPELASGEEITKQINDSVEKDITDATGGAKEPPTARDVMDSFEAHFRPQEIALSGEGESHEVPGLSDEDRTALKRDVDAALTTLTPQWEKLGFESKGELERFLDAAGSDVSPDTAKVSVDDKIPTPEQVKTDPQRAVELANEQKFTRADPRGQQYFLLADPLTAALVPDSMKAKIADAVKDDAQSVTYNESDIKLIRTDLANDIQMQKLREVLGPEASEFLGKSPGRTSGYEDMAVLQQLSDERAAALANRTTEFGSDPDANPGVPHNGTSDSFYSPYEWNPLATPAAQSSISEGAALDQQNEALGDYLATQDGSLKPATDIDTMQNEIDAMKTKLGGLEAYTPESVALEKQIAEKEAALEKAAAIEAERTEPIKNPPLPVARPQAAGVLGIDPKGCGGVCEYGNSDKTDGGSSVASIQKALNAQMGANLKVDGIYGPKTEAAVEAFQKANNLTVDGVVGPQTVAKMNEIALQQLTSAPSQKPAFGSNTLPFNDYNRPTGGTGSGPTTQTVANNYVSPQPAVPTTPFTQTTPVPFKNVTGNITAPVFETQQPFSAASLSSLSPAMPSTWSINTIPSPNVPSYMWALGNGSWITWKSWK